jgi:hypothetical protein
VLIEVYDGCAMLRFEGERVATASSEMPGKDRWCELSIFRVEDGSWVLAGVGKSRVPGEHDRRWAVVSRDPVDIVAAVCGRDTSWLAKRLLAGAVAGLQPAGPVGDHGNYDT